MVGKPNQPHINTTSNWPDPSSQTALPQAATQLTGMRRLILMRMLDRLKIGAGEVKMRDVTLEAPKVRMAPSNGLDDRPAGCGAAVLPK